MTRTAPALLVVLLALLAPATASAIVGGQPATEDYRHMALMVYDADDDADNNDYRFRCGASLLRQDWILTAAHCVHDDRNDDGEEEIVPAAKVRFVVGIRRRSEAATVGETLQAAEIRVHDRYHVPSYFSSDVALVRLESSATKGSPIRLASEAERGDWAPGKPSRVLGWGGTFYPGVSGLNTPDELHEVDVPIVDDDDCDASYPSDYLLGDFEPLTMVCAGELEGGKDACSGDSGGPLMVRNAAGQFVQMGIVSWGGGCAYPTQYGVYSRAADSFLRGWIEENLPAASEASAPPATEPVPAPDPTLPPAFPTVPSGGPQRPPDDITAIVSRVVLPNRRLRIGCRLVGKPLRSCQVEVFVRRTLRGRLTRRHTLTMPAGAKQTVRIGRPRYVVLRGVLLAQDGSRYRVRRTLRRSR